MNTESSPIEADPSIERKAAGNAAKLGALVADRWGSSASKGRARDRLGTGAAMAAPIDGVQTSFVLLDGDHGLGAALAWSRRAGAAAIHVIADEDPGTIARHATAFASDISVWRSVGRDLVAVEPSPLPESEGPPDAPGLVAVLEAEGLDVVVEGDRLAGEYRGLEVVRIVRAKDDGEPIFEVGVGRFDRELTTMMHGELPDASAVARVVEQLQRIRRPEAPIHPLRGLVPERWLRSTLLAEPERIGCESLVAAPTPIPRDRLRARGVAAAQGTRNGEAVVVACTVGVDLEAVVLAADARRGIDPAATLLIAIPERDVLPTVEAMCADLVDPAEIAPVTGEWRH